MREILRLNCRCGNCNGDGAMCCLIWSRLPEDLMVEILCHLPNKPLIQFKCVSKAWHFSIANICVPRLAASAPLSGFIFRKTIFRGDTHGFLTSDGHHDSRFVRSCSEAFGFPRWPMRGDIIGCYNGLVLLTKKIILPTKPFYIYNPATKQCVSIPVNPKHQTNSFVGMAFDPLCSYPHNNRYKIVRIAHSGDKSDLPVFDVFSSITGKWSSFRIPVKPRFIGCKWSSRSVYIDEKFYVLSCTMRLLSFDLRSTDDGKLSTCIIRLPKRATDGSGTQLGLISRSGKYLYYSRDNESMFHIWYLKEDVNKSGSRPAYTWMLNYSISINKLRQLPYGKHLSPMFIPFEIDPATNFIYVGSPYVVLKYNLQTKKLELFHKIEENVAIIMGRSCFHPYRRCLVMLSDLPSGSEA